ncbi:MAG: class II aldolase/adducin family protein, partial [Pseudomonadota bacterium]
MISHEHALRQAIVDTCRWLNTSGLNQGTSGNVSVRHDDGFLISPSATPYEMMQPEMVAHMDVAQRDGSYDGPKPPSTEWRFHRDIFAARPDVGAIVHAHSDYATALAIAHKSIPPCHYMVTAFGGHDIRCAPYARFGTQALSGHAVEALKGRMGCLLANHGMIALGHSLEQAKGFATELEALARQYWLSLQVGGPVLLTDAELEEVAEAMHEYGLALVR